MVYKQRMVSIFHIRNLLLCSVAVLMLSACGGANDDVSDVEEDKNETVEVLYNRAKDTFDQKDYKKAVDQFEEVERQHPYSDWANRAQVMAAFSAYKAEEYSDTAAIVDRFVKLHPTHESAPYAMYLKALSYYDQITDVGRDQKMTADAKQALQDVVSRYPDSEYARDAKLKLDLTQDHLAGKEMQIGRYYLKRDETLAAINRFRAVVEQYQTTSHIPEALHRLVEAYLRLGVTAEAQKYAAVLGHNYPDTEWYQYSYALLKEGNLAPEKKAGKGWLGL